MLNVVLIRWHSRLVCCTIELFEQLVTDLLDIGLRILCMVRILPSGSAKVVLLILD